MKLKKSLPKVIAGSLILCFMQAPVWAGTGDHGVPGDYLTYDIGARAAGMGGAMTGLADDVAAIFYNPAGLANQNPIQFGLQHVILFESTMFDFLGFAMPLEGIGNLGVGVVYLNSSGFDVRDANYNKPSSSSYQGASYSDSMSKLGVNFSYARDVMLGVVAGANLKVCNENLFGHSGTGLGLDLSGAYSPIPEFQVGLMLNNVLAPKVMSDTYPMGATLGLAGKFFNDALLLDVDVTKALANQGIKWKAGTQVDVYNNMAFVRAGLDDELRVAMGVGGKYLNITLDYAASIEALGLTHKISAGYSFGGFEVRVTATPKIFSPVGIKKTTTFAIAATSKYPIQSWELNVKDQNGDSIRVFTGEENPPNQVVWNGKDDRGLPAPDGNFSVQLAITDSNGKVLKSNTESVRIQSAVPLGEEGSGLDLGQ
jgi:hypothetical protein